MEIGEPTKEIPRTMHGQKGRYVAVYDAARRLGAGKWLPVTFASAHDAYNFRVAATTYRHLKLEARLRGRVVFIRPQVKNAKVKGGVR